MLNKAYQRTQLGIPAPTITPTKWEGFKGAERPSETIDWAFFIVICVMVFILALARVIFQITF
jgi:hypothetical protein